MEDILSVYARPYGPRFPLVCFDELPKTLSAHAREPQPATPRHPLREGFEYIGCDTANLFLWCEPLRSRRHVEVTSRGTREDWAQAIKDLVDVHYPDAERIVLVLDNLNRHTPASLYHAFPPAEANWVADKLEIHYTPQHGSWLNTAEIELSTLSRQCLDRRIPDQETLTAEVTAWERERNQRATSVDWRFTTEDARIKLTHRYP